MRSRGGRAAAFSAQRPTVAQNTESILSWDGKYEIWEFNSKGPAFSALKPGGPQKWLFGSVAETVDARPTYIWLKDTTMWYTTAVEISDLNSQDCGNAVPNQFIRPCQLSRPLVSRDCHVM